MSVESDKREIVRYHAEFDKIRLMYKTLISLLVGVVFGGFSFAYYAHGRISALEYSNGEGGRLTQQEFDTFYSSYLRERAEELTRLSSIEFLSKDTSDNLARMDTTLKFILEQLKEIKDK